MAEIIPFPRQHNHIISDILRSAFPVEHTPENLMAIAKECDQVIKRGFQEDDINTLEMLLDKLG